MFLSVITTILFFVFAGLVVVLFHPIQYLFYRFGGYFGQQKIINLSSRLVLLAIRITGAQIRITSESELEKAKPLVVVCNHQSLFDIPMLQLYFARFYPKFIAKHQLGKHFPSVSFALRHNGSVLIDRDNQAQAIRQIFDLGQRIIETNSAAVIFPEGSRYKDGNLHEFKSAGLKALLRKTPGATIIPVVINGNANLFRRSKFLICFGTKVHMHVLKPITIDTGNPDATINTCFLKMNEALKSIQA